jgi:CHAD domain-containing protein
MPLERKQLQKPFRKLRKSLKAFPKHPSPDLVHDVRTSSRRIEAIVAAMDLDSKPDVKRLRRRMSRVRKQAGKVRDMDVLTGFASPLRVDQEQDCVVRLVEFLGSRRYKKAAKMHAIVREETTALRRLLQRCSKRIEKFVGKDESQQDDRTASADVTALALRLSSELQSPAQLTRNNLHPYRLQVKQLQYVLQMAGDQSPEQERFIEKLKQVKDAIGEWHDWQELLSNADKVLDHRGNCWVLREIKSICDQKFQRALVVTNEMRKQYLNFRRDGELRGKRLPEPVLAAAAFAA